MSLTPGLHKRMMKILILNRFMMHETTTMNVHRRFLMSLTLGVVFIIDTLPASAQPEPAAKLLADELTRAARGVLESDSLTSTGIEAALALIRETTLLIPDDPGQWRTLLKVATLADRKDLNDQALKTLIQLDPDDEVARLMRLSGAIDQFQTLEERLDAYTHLLSKENRRHLGPAVASWLAFDLAMLHQRAGDTKAFSQWLAEACVIDSANREAAALAAGFFRARQVDPFAEAELLCNLLMADPTDLGAQVQLARLLTNAGAYQSADRIIELLRAGLRAEGSMMEDDMLADLAMVNWAQGDSETAIELILRRQAELDLEVRQQAAIDQPTLRMHELGQLFAQKNTILTTVLAAIRNRQGDEKAGLALLEVQHSYQNQLSELAELEEDTGAQRAQRLLELAWITLWLGDDTEAARESLERADDLLPLTQEAKSRFEGWFAYREGQSQRAVDLLEPMASDDPAARLGLALAQLELDEIRDGARNLLSVAREQPGSLMGIWSADLLAELLGQRVNISELAQRLTDLIQSLPNSFDRYPRHPTTALGFQILPVKRLYDPYEPILIDLIIFNHSIVPLAVDPAGPIRPQIILFPKLNFPGQAKDDQPPPIIVDIDRVLRLETGAREVIRIDLRHYGVGASINASPLSGTSISLSGMINFHAKANGSLEPGLLGSIEISPLIHVNGVRVTDSWIQQTNTTLETGERIDLPEIVLLSQVVASQEGPASSPLRQQLLDQATALVLSAFPALDPIERAWVLSVMPQHQAFEPIFNMARKSTNRLVKIAYLLFQNTGAGDPMLDAAMRGDDEVIRTLAEMIRQLGEDESLPSSSAEDGSP